MIDIGRKLSGRYEIIGNIGRGGMANVYLARDLILDREVAVKILRFDFQNDQNAIRRFQREALAATELVHPNVVGVYDVGEEDGMHFIVMEYVRGMDLKRYIQTNYPIPFRTIADIMTQILSAVGLAHEYRIIHRDLKPQNVLINEDGVVKITDFGIAIALSDTSLTQTNSMLGSVHYISPEQARGGMATKQSDIYAVGIILYEMLAGEVPFDGESAVTIALKHFQDDLPTIRNYNPNTPQSLENVVLKATAKDTADRYPTVEDMQIDLDTALNPERLNEPKWQPGAALNGETVVMQPVTPPVDDNKPKTMMTNDPTTFTPPQSQKPQTPAEKKSRKTPWIIGGIIAMILALALGAFYLLGNQTKDVNVPDVTGLTVEEATTKLQEAKFEVSPTTIEVSNEEIEKGKVVYTNPKANESVKEGREVKLYISSGAKNITLEDYQGKAYSDVVAILKEKGFTGDRIKKKSMTTEDDTPEDEIIEQEPAAGSEVDPEKDTITLTVSKGPEKTGILDYENWEEGTAKNDLEELRGMVVKIERKASDTYNEGYVMDQDPEEGTKLEKGSTVTLVVSTGPEAEMLEDLTGRSQSSAENYLANLGLTSSVTEEYSDTVEEGVVIRTNPASGSKVKKGEKVTLVVSKGAEVKTNNFSVRVSAKYQASSDNDSQTINIWKNDADGKSTIIATLIVTPNSGEQSTTIQVTTKGNESATIYTQRDAEEIVGQVVSGESEITAN
ncbi:beta-lactam-binding protein with PASTA domain [Enterococcus sp. PF1-24]|uniref:Stk1 family PASTA domain-containing Ser/Thr kinase n=1 Tax=unclassified Enterococcus TaxID=2608891 RepID=UPI002474764A|nr:MULTISPECIES: Stk1 family PASTA domain-containing Ser/Thr kinase [unclassified Enterococcus]MDH6364286.1 beta-lactam-binding protein with PASTA domain [Enterococcus sp. PFB1-1]MDH6401355.1 beta-lactam-binding protein with PASTA domain [Enterococcus sp. PF1-24]